MQVGGPLIVRRDSVLTCLIRIRLSRLIPVFFRCVSVLASRTLITSSFSFVAAAVVVVAAAAVVVVVAAAAVLAT